MDFQHRMDHHGDILFLISFVLILMAMQCFKEEAEEDIECRKLKKHWKFYLVCFGMALLCFYKYPSLNSEFLSTKKDSDYDCSIL